MHCFWAVQIIIKSWVVFLNVWVAAWFIYWNINTDTSKAQLSDGIFGPHQTEFKIKHETFVGQCQKLYLFSGPLDIPMARSVFIDLSGHMHIYNIYIPEQIVLPWSFLLHIRYLDC